MIKQTYTVEEVEKLCKKSYVKGYDNAREAYEDARKGAFELIQDRIDNISKFNWEKIKL